MTGTTRGRRARLIAVCGLPGTGKTTHALELVRSRDVIRLSADDWMDRQGVDLWSGDVRDRIEGLQWDLVQELLRRGQDVAIEWGTWSRAERDALRDRARELGAKAELHYLQAPLAELLDRLSARAAEVPPITEPQLREWANIFEPPDESEASTWDDFVAVGP